MKWVCIEFVGADSGSGEAAGKTGIKRGELSNVSVDSIWEDIEAASVARSGAFTVSALAAN
ncbi:hypothetical protein [Providencia alcalifaciens]|uniref:hypothetical protein n=1 Tax=Providencia alcalifaciens TaxID=126385 RepID=UPI002B05F1F5|nr:hypothetical protein [Providencia alcalifaciens]